jgi:predicted nuclease with TOPRIM domain
MSTTRDILLSRKSELVAQLPAMAEKFTELRKTLIDMEAQFGAHQKELEAIDEALKKLAEPEATAGPITIMQAVLEVLNHKPQGMTALEILDEINEAYFNGTIVRTSLSPQLSRLKNRDKKIELRGNRWYRLPKEPTLFNRRI